MPVKIAIVGCGAIGQRRHIPECVANPDSRLTALVDPVPGRATELARKWGGEPFIDYRQMLKHADVDAVVVCGPNALHAAQTIDALKAGKHVLCEKPMATTRRDALAMIAAAKKAKRFLMIGQNQRLMPAHRKAKEILDSGRLGKPLTFRSSFKHPGPEGWSVDAAKSWFFKKDAAVMGVTGDLGVHKADLMRWLLGQEFVEVSAQIGTLDKRGPDGKLIPLDDNALLILKTQKGLLGSIEVSWTNYGAEDNATIVYCQKGVLYMGTDPQYGVIVRYGDGQEERYRLGDMATNTRQVASGVMDAFVKSLLDKRKPEIDGMEGYQSLDVILTAMEAGASGKVRRIGKQGK
ncbi:MAG: Gfo/Idh/MocA family oxidoreductase [Phycisphaeraceae bacterium]|nr:Gfo/Idh/MocA family oxidoreductase [Phycisphaeraceae bacterium]